MYLRVFHDLWNSSLMAESVPVRWLFITMLGMADKARSGVIDVPLFILSRQAGMTEEETRAALATLAAPDPSSRSEKEEGRRVVALRPDVERGWEIVNWEEYAAQFRAADRRQQVKEAASRHREKIKFGAHVPKQSEVKAASSAVISRNPNVIKIHEGKGREGKSSLLPSGSLEVSLKSTPKVRDQDAPSAPSPSDLLRIWNENRGEMLPAKSLAGDRLSRAKARLKDQPDLTVWAAAIKRASASAFCTGSGERGWKANLDWLLRPSTLSKILEGQTDDNGKAPSGPGSFNLRQNAEDDANKRDWAAKDDMLARMKAADEAKAK